MKSFRAKQKVLILQLEILEKSNSSKLSLRHGSLDNDRPDQFTSDQCTVHQYSNNLFLSHKRLLQDNKE